MRVWVWGGVGGGAGCLCVGVGVGVGVVGGGAVLQGLFQRLKATAGGVIFSSPAAGRPFV